MAKKYRVKHYYGKNGMSFRAKPRVLTVVLVLLLFVGLGYIGTIIYRPVYDFVMNLGKEPPPVAETLPEPEPEPEAESEPEPQPPAEPEYKPLRAVYVPMATGGTTANLDAIISGLEGTDVNAVMIDIKNPAGDVLFKTKNEMANKWGVVSGNAVDLRELADKLESKGLMLAAKMSVFRDPRAASAGRLAYAINYQDSEFLWLDAAPEDGGRPWLNPYSIPTQEYINSLAEEAFDAGVKLLVLENVQFPDNSAVYATFGKDAVAMSRAEILETTVINLQKKAEEKGARVAVTFPVTAVTNTEGEGNRYGGSILKIAGEYLLLDVSPSQFASGFSQNGLDIGNAGQDPIGAVRTAIDYIRQGVSHETKIIPILSGGDGEQEAIIKELRFDEYFLQK